MSGVFVHGVGAVSPAGWGVPALCAVAQKNEPLPTQPLARPGWDKLLRVRAVPPPSPKPAFLAHPRLRRANSITQYTVAAALEAMHTDVARLQAGSMRLGVVVCAMAGCVTYSRRFFEETLKDPTTASPLLFPETVFNAPASHLSAYLGATGMSYTLVGDEGTFAQGLALAADRLVRDQADACVVVGVEETDWPVANAMRYFHHNAIHSEGAGALYLKRETSGSLAELSAVTDSFPFTRQQNRTTAARRMRAQLPEMRAHQAANGATELLCLGTQCIPRADAVETAVWNDWTGPRLTPKGLLGEGFNASTAWQCVLACEALRSMEFSAANVSVVGTNEQAIGVRFVRPATQAAA